MRRQFPIVLITKQIMHFLHNQVHYLFLYLTVETKRSMYLIHRKFNTYYILFIYLFEIKHKTFFVQVNIGEETTKSGVKPTEVNGFLDYCTNVLKLNEILPGQAR